MMDTIAAARATGGRAFGRPALFLRVTTDSRTLQPGDLFVALTGERFDGHDFVAQALAGGAAAAMVAQARAGEFSGPLVAVADPLEALGRLAAAWRERFSGPLVLVVGSNGKTTVKEMTVAILRAALGDAAVLATRGNLNNAIGLPLTLLSLRSSHRAAVIEAGMNHRGETRTLAGIAKPTIAIVNNAQREHQEFMASVDEVAAEHADAIGALAPGGTAVINADDAHAATWRAVAERVGARVVGFGFGEDADVRGTCALRADGTTLSIRTAQGDVEVELAVPGRPMAMNALAASAAALAAGASLASVRAGLGSFRAVAGRLAVRAGRHGATVIDDSYNANPDSVRAAIDVLAATRGERVLLLGDMGEVGSEGPAFHREVGAYAKAVGLDALHGVGTLAAHAVEAFGERGTHHPDLAALTHAATDLDRAGTTMLVKGSRFMGMDAVVTALTGENGGH